MLHGMDYALTLTLIGIAALGMAWMPSLSNRIKISYSVIYVLLGMIVYTLFGALPDPDPLQYPRIAVHFTELVVIIALMGSGLKIDQPFSFRNWGLPLRLVTVSMTLCIFLTGLLAHYYLGLDIAAAVLIAAVLAPTDPVLASDVQVGPPLQGEKELVRFSLTAEGGMNDGTAFPFVWLAVYLAVQNSGQPAPVTEWLVSKLFYKIAAGVVLGLILGKFLGHLLFRIAEKNKNIRINDGFAALSITLFVYGCTELLNGYGFIAVFICAVTLRNEEMGHKLHVKLHSFTEQIEKILVAITLLLFGGSLVSGILNAVNWHWIIFAVVFILIIRPVTTWLAIGRVQASTKEKLTISFFGIRGIGSFYYISFALTQASFPEKKELWSGVALVVLISIILHGITAGRVMRRIEEESGNGTIF